MNRPVSETLFTPAQEKIMALLAKGVLPGQVHKELGIAQGTVSTQLSRICLRLKVKNWLQALLIYLQQQEALGRRPPYLR